MHPDIDEIQSKLKEILYDCAVEVRATKAALYLLDQPNNKYDLVTEYGFRGALRAIADQNDPIVDRCGRGRTTFFINGLMTEPRFSEILYESATDRLLVAPIYLRGQLVGFVDIRDKAAKQPFEQADLPKAQKIADRVGELFSSKNTFGQRFIQVSGAGTDIKQVLTGVYSAAAVRTGEIPAVAAPPKPTLVPPLPPAAAASQVPRISSMILEARTTIDRALVAPPAETMSDADVAVVRDVLRLTLLIPGAVVASFVASGLQEIVSRGPMADDALQSVQSKLQAWLAKRGETATFARRNAVNASGSAVGLADIQKVFTAPVGAGAYVTVVFATDPDRAGHDALAALHRQLQSRRSTDANRTRIAERLLEPDFVKFPELRNHTAGVVARVDAFAKFLGLNAMEAENVHITAMVHDVGMRLLDYDKLYRKRDLSHDEMETLKQHPVVGAAIIEPFLGREIARAVLAHHERYDGGGYPNGLRGADIPLPARLLQICDVYEAMTASDNYQTPQTHDLAMTVISRGAGTQFDAELANRFTDMMRR